MIGVQRTGEGSRLRLPRSSRRRGRLLMGVVRLIVVPHRLHAERRAWQEADPRRSPRPWSGCPARLAMQPPGRLHAHRCALAEVGVEQVRPSPPPTACPATSSCLRSCVLAQPLDSARAVARPPATASSSQGHRGRCSLPRGSRVYWWSVEEVVMLRWALGCMTLGGGFLLLREVRAAKRVPRLTPLPPDPVLPPVAVLIPARDEARRIPRLLNGLAAQTHPCFEVVVLDDHSTDATASVVSGAPTAYRTCVSSRVRPYPPAGPGSAGPAGKPPNWPPPPGSSS